MVGDEDEGEVVLQGVREGEDSLSVARIEALRDLVQDEELGFRGDSSRDDDELLLALTEVGKGAVEVRVAQPEERRDDGRVTGRRAVDAEDSARVVRRRRAFDRRGAAGLPFFFVAREPGRRAAAPSGARSESSPPKRRSLGPSRPPRRRKFS